MSASYHSNIREVGSAMHKGAVRGLTMAAEHVLGIADGRVPLEEGTLARSGETAVDEANLVAAVSYGGQNETLGVIAIVQHEHLEYQHAPGRQAKYLESALNESADEVQDIIAAQIRRALR